MPPGPWKSKLEILREDMTRRDAEWRVEVQEARLFNRELLIRLEQTYANLGGALAGMGATLDRMGDRIDTNTEEVKAQTQAILKLVDRFKEPNGRPPV
jgi:hypothetical protein